MVPTVDGKLRLRFTPAKRSSRLVVATYDIIARPALTRMRRSVGVMGMNLDSPSTVPLVIAHPTGSSQSKSRVSPAMTASMSGL
jgi:hypothetical protein